MSTASSFFRTVPVDSPVHRLLPETKIIAGVVISIGLVFNPAWSHVGIAALLVVLTFKAAKLPWSVVPRIPSIVRYGLFGGLMGSGFSGGDPVIFGLGLGGLLDFARLISLGLVMILWAGILSWTTGLTAVGFGIRRLITPLGRIGLPVDEIGTTITLAVRALPIVADEVRVVNESVTSRPAPAEYSGKPFREAFSFIGDTASAVVVNSQRRARDLAIAMVSRGETTAPAPRKATYQRLDVIVLIAAFSLCLLAFFIPGVPEIDLS